MRIIRTRYLLALCLMASLAACVPYAGYEEGYYGGYGWDYCPYGYCYPNYYYPYTYYPHAYYYYPYGYRYRGHEYFERKGEGHIEHGHVGGYGGAGAEHPSGGGHWGHH